jgi:arsenate reductase
VNYIKTKPSRDTLRAIVAGLEDPVADLVRKDANFEKLGLREADFVDNPEAVVDILEKHPALMQRPVLVKGRKAIIGRPKDRVRPFAAG